VRIFPNGESCLRLARALAVETHENWLEQPPPHSFRRICTSIAPSTPTLSIAATISSPVTHRYLNMGDLR
jgi:hypothetical protein